jgi:hypothetical protein
MAREVSAMVTSEAAKFGADDERDYPGGVEVVRAVFENHLQAQGSSIDLFHRRVQATLTATYTMLRSTFDGPLDVDLGAVRDILVESQGAQPGAFSDPVGIDISAVPGTMVKIGQTLARIRSSQPLSHATVARLEGAFRIRADCGPSEAEAVAAPAREEQRDLEIVRA